MITRTLAELLLKSYGVNPNNSFHGLIENYFISIIVIATFTIFLSLLAIFRSRKALHIMTSIDPRDNILTRKHFCVLNSGCNLYE